MSDTRLLNVMKLKLVHDIFTSLQYSSSSFDFAPLSQHFDNKICHLSFSGCKVYEIWFAPEFLCAHSVFREI